MPGRTPAERLAFALWSAGANRQQATTLTAIGLAESGGNAGALHVVGACRMRGAWQINSCAHPEVLDPCAFSLKCSAGYALLLFSAQGGQPWSTYTSGAYRSHLGAAATAVAAVWAGIAGAVENVTVPGVTNAVGDAIAGALGGVMGYVVRGGAILGGAALVLLALYFLAGGANPVQVITGAAGKLSGGGS
jgi:hypothetical protein